MNARLARRLSDVVYVASRGILEVSGRLESAGWSAFYLSMRIRSRGGYKRRIVTPELAGLIAIDPIDLSPIVRQTTDFPIEWTPTTTIEERLYEPEVPLEREFPHLWAEEDRYGEFD